MPRKPYLEAGQVVGTHGVRGELRVQPWCDSAEAFCRLKRVYLGADGSGEVKVACRPHKTIALVKMDGVDTIPDAERLRGSVLYLAREDFKLPEGRYFIQDIIGLAVVDADTGETYGSITDVSETGANDVYHMRMGEREVLIPAVPSIVRSVDIDGGRVAITPIKGLLSDED